MSYPLEQTPTREEVEDIDRLYKFNSSKEEIETYCEIMKNYWQSYKYVEDYDLPPYVWSYDRDERSYNRPSKENNPYNAWYVQCNIKGKIEGKLMGKRIAVKDNTAVAGLPMMNGSALMEGYIPEYDATVVRRVLADGGTIVGKTTCEDMCMSGGSHMTKYGPVKNPYNPAYTSGGSSSGSAVVVALGEADMAIGGDQGGSIRIPASCCGIVGLKPTHGLVPYTGAVPIVPSFDHLGPMAKNVADCALLLDCIAGFDDDSDYRQNPFTEKTSYSEKIFEYSQTNKKLKVGILKEGVVNCEKTVSGIFYTAVDLLKANKILDFEEISLPLFHDWIHVYLTAFNGGIYGSMVKGQTNGYGTKGLQSHTLSAWIKKKFDTDAEEASMRLKLLTMIGEYCNQRHGNYHTCKANSIGVQITHEIDNIFKDYDAFIMPTIVKKPPLLPSSEASIKTIFDATLNMNLNTAIFNMTGHPAISINCGYHDNLPIGLQIVAKKYEEAKLLYCASVFEKSLKSVC